MSSNILSQSLIPGLPDDLAMRCLIHLPFPYHFLARSVSSSWNRVLSSYAFLRSKSLLTHLFVFAFNPNNRHSQWQSLDPRSLRWFLLPPIPSLPDFDSEMTCPPASAFTAIPHSGQLFVLGGLQKVTHNLLRSVMIYHASTNSWSVGEPMSKPRAFFYAATIDERELLIMGGDFGTGSVERWEPGGMWRTAAGMEFEVVERYNVEVIGSRMYVRPLNIAPKAVVYNNSRDEWEEMQEGMREGWRGSSVVIMGRLFIIPELSNAHMKVYDEDKDVWDEVDGGGVPKEIQRPITVAGTEDGAIYVVGKGLNVAVGEITVLETEKRNGWKVKWNVVVKGPPAFCKLFPFYSVILFA